MQYLLTEQEYNALCAEQRLQTKANQEELQALCTQAAMHIPIVVEWWTDKTPRPWGCILGPQDAGPVLLRPMPRTKGLPTPAQGVEQVMATHPTKDTKQ